MEKEDQKLMAGATALGLEVAGQVAAARCSEDGAEAPNQAQALGGQRRSDKVGDALGQGEHGSQPELQAPRNRIIANLDDVGDVAGEMGEAGLGRGRVTLLGGVAVRDPDRGLVPSIISRTTTAPYVGEA